MYYRYRMTQELASMFMTSFIDMAMCSYHGESLKCVNLYHLAS